MSFEIILAIIVIILMFFIGMSLNIKTLVREFILIDKKFTAICLSQILLIPLITYLLTEYVFSIGSEFQFFLMILSLAPGAVTSTFFIKLIDGNTYLSVKISIIISLLSVLTIPLLLKLFLEITDSEIPINLTRSIFQLVIIIAVPVLTGSIISTYWQEPSKQTIRWVTILGIALAYILGIIDKYDLLEISFLIPKFPILLMFLFIYTGIGILVALLFKLHIADTKTVIIETFMQNMAVVLLIINFLIPTSPFIILAVTWTTMQIMMAVGIYYFYHYFRKRNQT
jgi:BASS family bile acid:Na+ symporter|tara:strand:+ start:532 stop:1383 length:852 start_codon:yes stop_codon:yes gene_type:complete